MSSFEELIDWVGSRTGGRSVHVECRQCGTTLSEDATSCPCCGSSDISTVSL